ncbi:MAG: transcriptional repressor [Oligoflexia bacterium]|nr:transcriptional repressor [Oligoflexia bacterium]
MKVKACKHSDHNKSSEKAENLLNVLRKLKFRVTPQRKIMVEKLVQEHHPVSAEELYKKLPKKTTDLVTVFRFLNNLEELGLVQKFDLNDGIRRYEAMSQDNNHHHHYIQCKKCGSIEAFDGCDFDEQLSKILIKKGYVDLQHSLEVKAICLKCAS